MIKALRVEVKPAFGEDIQFEATVYLDDTKMGAYRVLGNNDVDAAYPEHIEQLLDHIWDRLKIDLIKEIGKQYGN